MRSLGRRLDQRSGLHVQHAARTWLQSSRLADGVAHASVVFDDELLYSIVCLAHLTVLHLALAVVRATVREGAVVLFVLEEPVDT